MTTKRVKRKQAIDEAVAVAGVVTITVGHGYPEVRVIRTRGTVFRYCVWVKPRSRQHPRIGAMTDSLTAAIREAVYWWKKYQ